MALLDELGSLVQTWGHGSLTSPVTIFLGHWTGKPDNIVALKADMGRRSIRRMGVGVSATVYQQPHVQVYVRRSDPEQAEIASKDLHDRFDGFTGTVLGVRYFLIEALQPPMSMGVTENQLMQYAFNLHVRREPVP
jgi:hypothetical protein